MSRTVKTNRINHPENAITRLSAKERARLTGQAHDLDPVVHVGQDGLSASVLRTIDEAFNRRELLKLKVLENAPATARDTAGEIVEKMKGVSLVRVVGRIVLLYRPRAEANK